jgi:acyl-coenzyme A thioesterase PaaI-like protein
LTSDIHVRLLQPAKQRDLIATAQIVRLGARSIVAEMKVTSADDLIATATAAFAKLGELPMR